MNYDKPIIDLIDEKVQSDEIDKDDEIQVCQIIKSSNKQEAYKMNDNAKDKNNNKNDQSISFSTYNCKQFYESSYNQAADDLCFVKIDQQSIELCNQINEAQKNSTKFAFEIKDINNEKKIRSFINKFKSADMFLIYFKLRETPGKTKKSKPTIDYKVRSGFLNNIEKICIILNGELIINYFQTKQSIKLFYDELYRHGFEFEKDSVTLISFDAKLTYKILKCCFEFDDSNLNKIIWHDPKIAHWLIDPDVNEPMSILDILHYLQIENLNEFSKQINDSERDPKILFQSILLYPIMSHLKRMLINSSERLFDCYVHVEMPVLLIFGSIELAGFTIDKLYLKKSIKDWSKFLNRLNGKVKERNDDQEVNPRSPAQVFKFLAKNNLYQQYVELFGLAEGQTIDKLGTGKEILEKMKSFSDLPGYILDQRNLLHISDFAKNLEAESGDDSTIMGLFKHFISTGRVSMHEPNLLGIDKDHKILIDEDTFDISIKKGFVAKQGYILIAADYSQLELRILASLAQETNLIEIFNLDKDPFKMIASKIKNKPIDEINDFERNSTKQIIYAIIYGMGMRRLALNLGVENEEAAKQFLNEFYETFPYLKIFIETCKEHARKTGYAETLLGRRRILPDINSENDELRASDERKAVNSKIQGSAADLVKLSMLKIKKAIEDEKFEAQFLLQVHDELIFQIKNDEEIIKKFDQMLRDKMTDFSSVLKTKFSIKAKRGLNFGDIEEIDQSKSQNKIDLVTSINEEIEVI